MKLNRKTAPSPLWGWIAAGNLPRGLVAKEISVGYGRFCGIYRAGEVPNFVARHFEMTGDPVAVVYHTEVELNHPEYFSDFEDLLRKWEGATGVEPTLTYWESQ